MVQTAIYIESREQMAKEYVCGEPLKMEITTWDIIYLIYGEQDNQKYFIPH